MVRRDREEERGEGVRREREREKEKEREWEGVRDRARGRRMEGGTEREGGERKGSTPRDAWDYRFPGDPSDFAFLSGGHTKPRGPLCVKQWKHPPESESNPIGCC